MKLVIGMLAVVIGFSGTAYANNLFYKTKYSTFAGEATTTAAAPPRLLYYGGPVISNVKVYAVFWGASVDGNIQKNIGGFYKAISNSNHMDLLTQYNTTNIKAIDGRVGTDQSIGRGSYGGEYLITPQTTQKTALEDRDVQVELESQIANHVLPAPDENSLYMIYFPEGVSITIAGQTSCRAFCAYHDGFVSSKFGSVFYGVMPDLSSIACSLGCGFELDKFKQSTKISSHEFFEAVSDAFPTPGDKPSYPQAWNTDKGEEMADICTEKSGQLKAQNTTYEIQGEWDNASGSCVAGPYQAN